MRIALLGGSIVALSVPLAAQVTGRSMNLRAPAVIGQTARFAMTYPVSATGNLYVFLWCCPPFPATTTLTVPGFTLVGAIRVDPLTTVSAYSGVLGPLGTVAHSLAVPNDVSFVGYAWDLQSVDLEASTCTVRFADNELTIAIANTPPPNLVPIPPGTFQMGSNATTGPPYYSTADERPVHQVTISRPFWIGSYEVTQSEYQAVTGTNPSYFRAPAWPNGPNQPVEQVTWNDAMAYCAALTAQQAALGRVPSGYQYRLPTEAEWEYCCRAGATTEYNCGPTLDCPQARFRYSWPATGCSTGSTVVVGNYAPNAWGLFDMHGNVFEWCLDAWDGSANYPPSPVVDPYVQTGPFGLVRGGGWNSISYDCRSANRHGVQRSSQNLDRGFRVVLAPVLP
ncbi:MAG: formylglycine-generating enzyme family protein [Planctomycetes bacterium]|nr:formylglycine-generating enzyme family protein [Planctomycetota bacterium]